MEPDFKSLKSLTYDLNSLKSGIKLFEYFKSLKSLKSSLKSLKSLKSDLASQKTEIQRKKAPKE